MMDQVEKTQKVVELTGTSYAEAKEALEQTDWDVLSAILSLEKDGKVERGTASYSTGRASGTGPSDEMLRSQQQWQDSSRRSSFSEMAGNVWGKVSDFLMLPLIVEHDGRQVAVIPMFLVLIVLCVFRTLALIAVIASLFFGIRYRFDGLDAVTVDVNGTMDRMADMADSLANGASAVAESGSHDTQEEPADEANE